MLTPAQYVTTPGGWGQGAGVWDRARIENLLDVKFQNGPVAIHGVNGVEVADVLTVIRDYIKALGKAEGSRERSMVVLKLDEALQWERTRVEADNTRERALDRVAAGRSA